MRRQHKKQIEFTSVLRSFLSEFFTVFFVITFNGTILVSMLATLLRKEVSVYEIGIWCLLYILVGGFFSSLLIYYVKGRVFANRIKDICNASRKVAKGDFSVRVPEVFDKPKSEIDYLTYNFNKMVRELSSLENMKNDFVADVSHEIKTPLSVIQGYADLLQTKGLSEEERAEYVELISASISNLTALVTNILKLNKIENQQIVKKEYYYLDEQVCTCLLNFEDAIAEKNIEIKADLPELKVYTDKALLEIVFNNLFSNAVKFTEYGGKISVSLCRKGKNIEIVVKDNGCGMNKQTQRRIFDKFYQGDTSHSEAGNGLGLALVDRVVSLLESDITVKSKEGKGSEFKILLKETGLN